VWDCTDVPPASTWPYLEHLAFPETVVMLLPSILEMYREVSLLPTGLINTGSAEQSLIRESQMEISLNQLVEQFVNEKITRSLNTYQQLIDTIEHKRRHKSRMNATSMVDCP
jgi:transaldolase